MSLIFLSVFTFFFTSDIEAAFPAYRSSGTFTNSAGAVAIPYPGDMAANDVCLLAVESENEAISLSSAQGFAEITAYSPQSAGTAATNPGSRLAVFWKRTVGGDTNPTVADSGNHQTGRIHCFSGVITSGDPWNIGAGGNDSAANDTSANIPGATTTVHDTLVVLLQSTSFNGTSTNQCGDMTNADLANITERTDNSSTINLGGGHCMATGEKATPGSYTTTTLTMANTTYKGAISLALRPQGVTLSGNVYTGEGSGNIGANKTVDVRINGTGTYTDETDASGIWSLANMAVNSGDVFTAYLDDETEEGTTVMMSDGTTKSDIDIYQNRVITRMDTGSSITPDNLYTGDDTDDDVKYVVSASSNGNLTVDSGFELHVWTGDTFDASGGTVTTQGSANLHIDDSGVATLDTSTNTIAGDILVDDAATANINQSTTINGGDITVLSGGDVASSGGTVTMGASGTIGGGSTGSVFQLTNLTVSTGTTTLGADADNTLAFTGDISVSTGATLAMNGKTADIDGGNLTTAGTGTVTCSSCTSGGVTLAGDGTTNGIGGGGIVTVYSLTLDGSTNTTNAGSAVTVMNSLTVGSSRTLAMGANNLTVGDTNVTNSGGIAVTGVISQTSSATTTVKSSSGGAATIGGTGCTSTNCTFYNLTFGPTVASAPTFTLGSAAGQTITVSNALTIGDGTNPVTVNAETNDPTVDVNGNFVMSACTACNTTYSASTDSQLKIAGNFTNVSAGVFTPNSGTVLMDGTSGSPKTVTSAGDSFNNLSIDNGGTAITWELQDALDVNGNLLIDTSNTLDTKSGGNFNVNVAGNLTNNGTYTARTNTTTLDGSGGTTQAITGDITYSTLSITTSSTRVIQVENGSFQTISTNITLTGTSCNAMLIFRSSVLADPFQFTNSDATPTVSYVDFQDTTINTNTFSSGTGITDSGGNTGITFDGTCEGGSNSADASNYSFQRKTFKDSTNNVHWILYHDGDQIEYKYSSDNGSTWVRAGGLPYDTNDFSVWQTAISTTEYVWLVVKDGNDIKVRQGTLSSTNISWDTDVATIFDDADGRCTSYSYSHISLDNPTSGNPHLWALARCYDGANYVIETRATATTAEADPSTWTYDTASQISNDQSLSSNVYGNIVPISSGDMYATFVVNTGLLGCKWDDDDGTGRWENSDGTASCVPVAGGVGETEGSSTRGTGGVKIDDAGDPGVMAGAGRQIIQTSGGNLYSVFNDGGSIEVWKSTDGSSWTQKDAGNSPGAEATGDVSVSIDEDNILHIVYEDTALRYITFDTADGGAADDAFNTEETPESDTDTNTMSIAIDANNIPHVVYVRSTVADSYLVKYRNRIGGSWSSEVSLDNLSFNAPKGVSIVISEDDIPEISYINLFDSDLTAAVGNQNNASSFTLQDVDTVVNSTADQSGSSIGVDSDGNTWIAYIDGTTNYVTLAKHADAAAWTTWTIVDGDATLDNNNVGYEPSLSIIGKTIFVFFQNSPGGISYDAYDSGTQKWMGIFNTTGLGFQDAKVRYSNYNFHEPWLLDYLYSDGTDIYWNYVDLRPTKIDDASNFGVLPTEGRQIIKTNSGNYYAVVHDFPNIEVWRSSDGYVWEQQDSASSPNCGVSVGCSSVAVGIRSTGVIDIVYHETTEIVEFVTYSYDLEHITFNTANDTFGSQTTLRNPADNVVITNRSLTIDSSDYAHIIWREGINLYYSNNISGSFKSPVTVEALNPGSADLTIDMDGKPQIAYINSTDDDLTVVRGDANNATEFTTAVHDVDTDISDIPSQRGVSIGVNTLTGDTWVAYINDTSEDDSGTNDAVTLAKHAYADGWTTWSTVTTKTDVGYEPSIAIAGSSDIYVFYQDDGYDIAYDVYDSDADTPAWDGETVLHTGTFQDVKAKWSFEWNNFGANRIDYLYADGTDVYWDYLYVRRSPTNIDNASDFPAMGGSSRQIVRTSTGVLYAVVNDSGSTEVWKSADNGDSWSQQDSADSPASHSTANKIALAIDSSDTLHILFTIDVNGAGGPPDHGLRYITFTTSNNQFGTTEDVNTPDSIQYGVSLSVDNNDVPHIVLAEYNGVSSDGGIHYNNRVGGSWIGTAVELEDIDIDLTSVDITISDENVPEIAYTQSVGNDLTAAIGDDNDPDTAGQWTTHDVDIDIVDTLNISGTLIGNDSTGNTWIAYVDENGTDDYITLTKHTDGTTWNDDANWTVVSEQSSLSNNKVGNEPSLAIDGTDIYVFYKDDQDNIVFDVYDSVGASWSGETLIEEHGALQDVKARWSYINNYDSTGVAPVQTNTYYFNGSDMAATDNDNAWTNETNADDGDITTDASTSTTGSATSNEIAIEGTDAPITGGTITSVKARIYGDPGGIMPAINGAIYTDGGPGSGALLGTPINDITSGEGWDSYTTLSTPAGGWTWQKISDLESYIYFTADTPGSTLVSRIEILVESTNSSSQAEFDYIYSDGTDVFYNRYSLGGSTPGTQDAVDTVPTGLTKTISAVSDSTNFDIHLVFVDDESTDQVSYRRWDNGTTTWQAATLVPDAAGANDAYPTISIDTNSRDLTVFWIDVVSGSDAKIFYNVCDVSAATLECSTATDWGTETQWKTTVNSAITSSYGETNEVFAMWSVGSTNVTIDWGRIAAVSASTFTLSNYRWYVDSDTLDVTDAWSATSGIDLAENTELTPLPVAYDPLDSTQEIRLRVAFTVNSGDLSASAKQFKLQYRDATDTSCTSGSWTDLGASNAWNYATSGVTDGATIITTRITASDVGGQYAKSAPTTANANTASTTQDIEYDFHIIAGSAFSGATRYLFRIVESTGTVFDAYTNCPALTTEPGTESLMRHGNFYTNYGKQGFWWAD